MKIVAILTLLVLGRRYLHSEYNILRYDLGQMVLRKAVFRIALFCVLYAALVALTLATPFLRDTVLRVALVAYLGFSAVAAIIHRNITGQYIHERAYFDEGTAEVLLREIGMARDAFATYRRELLSAALPAAIFAGILIMPMPGAAFGNGYGCLLIAIAALCAICQAKEWIFIHGKGQRISFPAVVMTPVRCVNAIFKRDAAPHVKLSEVGIAHVGRTLDKVVFIMDESVRGDYTTLGNRAIDTTPYLADLGDRIANYGIALSGHNCSSYSRYILRHGVRAEALPQALAHGLNLPGPNIWQFAKRAGLRTVYIDGFSNHLRLHSGMSLREAGFIDDYIRIPAAPPHQRDIRVAECLRRALDGAEPAFIYVDKYGVHAPYDDKAPPGPVDGGLQSDASRLARLVATYKSAVRWNVDEFFRRVLTGLDMSGKAMIYTSDHGQSLLEGGYAGTHCTVGPNIAVGEALVPLFAIAGDTALRDELDAASREMRDRASHFDIFPALLVAFGYARAEVEAAYGAGLFGGPARTRRFLSGFKASATWVDVV